MTDVKENLFNEIVDDIHQIGVDLHSQRLIDHAKQNLQYSNQSIKQLPPLTGKKAESAIVISAGPSVHKKEMIRRIKESDYQGSIIAVDGAYIASLKQGLIPDYVVTLDPHLTRIVRWFGDHDFVKHTEKDDYFARQDLDVEFRKNTIEQNKYHIELVDKYGHQTKAIVASSAPANVVDRIREAKMDAYWWNPLVDNPSDETSVTRQIYNINKLPCMNTGGTVGTAAWVFAYSYLKINNIAVAGMDLGYYHDTPLEKTQSYYELIDHLGGTDGLKECFVDFTFPLTNEKFYTDPTYFWYRRNFLELLAKANCDTYNCTEGGTLFGDGVTCMNLDEFLTMYKS